MRAVLASGLAALSLVAVPSIAAAHGSTQTHGHTAKLAELREVTASYKSGPAEPWTTRVVDLAGISCIDDPQGRGGMGIHFVDLGNLTDGQVDRLAPEALIYEPGPDGSLGLVAVGYLVFAEAWDSAHARPPSLHGTATAFPTSTSCTSGTRRPTATARSTTGTRTCAATDRGRGRDSS